MQKRIAGTACQFTLVGSLALAATTPGALAQDIFSALMEGGTTTASNWDVTLGGGVLYAPKYEGSKNYELKALPFAEVVWKEALFISTIDGLGVNLLSHEGFKAGIAVGYDFGRDEDDSKSELRGIGDIDGGVTGSAFLSYNLGFASAKTEVKQYFAGSEGTTVDLGVKAFIPVSLLMGEGLPERAGASKADAPRVPAISLGASTEWADKDYMQSYFGVSAAQAASSGKTAFNASSGFKSVSLETGLHVPVTEHVMVSTMFTYKRLLGDAADSPLSNDDNQFSGAAFVTYEF